MSQSEWYESVPITNRKDMMLLQQVRTGEVGGTTTNQWAGTNVEIPHTLRRLEDMSVSSKLGPEGRHHYHDVM